MIPTTRLLKSRLETGPVLVCPGAANALAARLIEEAGFEVCYVTGAGIANTYLGAPDIGLLTLNELAGHVSAIRDSVNVPLIVDADTGFGNPIGVQRTVRMLERAGADAIQLEDQVFPKRCGHFAGKRVVPAAEMAAKVRAAADARDAALIIARTDARSVEGFASAIERAERYAAAGADVTFVEAPETVAELLAVPERLPGIPQVVNLVEGGRTPLLPVSQLGSFRLALFANAALQAAVLGMQRALATLYDTGSLAAAAEHLVGWTERQRIVRKPVFDEVEERYADD